MFIGASSIQTAFTFGDLIEWLIPIILILGGMGIVKKHNKNKLVKTAGTLLAAVGIFLLLWMILWQVVAIIVFLC